MVLKLYGSTVSTCTARVRTTLKELDVPFELVEINLMTGENRSPAFIEKQPFGQIPYIDDDGFILFESRAICRYLAAKYAGQGKSLLPSPTDLKATALFEQAASIEISTFNPSMERIATEQFFKPKFFGLETDKAVVAQSAEYLTKKWDGYETILSKQKYLAGENFTLADLFHLPYGTIYVDLGHDGLTSDKWPNVARWWKDISSRPSWAAVNNKA